MTLSPERLVKSAACCCLFYSDELEKFMENQGAPNSGILILTTSLSKPFVRLDKYVTVLQELERHMEVRETWASQALCTQNYAARPGNLE